jgi:predicted XRE-type DNA-binding protein
MAGKQEKEVIVQGNSNVFEDLGLDNADERLAKAKLASAIGQIIEDRGLTQVEAGALMGIDQPKVSKIVRGRLGEFSTERLLSFLMHLGSDVEIVVRRKRKRANSAGSLKVALVG